MIVPVKRINLVLLPEEKNGEKGQALLDAMQTHHDDQVRIGTDAERDINKMNNSYNLDDIKWSLMVNQLLNNIDINKMSQDNICELLLDNRKIIGSRVYLQKDNNT